MYVHLMAVPFFFISTVKVLTSIAAMTLEGLRCTFVGKISNDFATEIDILSNPRILNSPSCIDFVALVV